jgi:hypothetical protein
MRPLVRVLWLILHPLPMLPDLWDMVVALAFLLGGSSLAGIGIGALASTRQGLLGGLAVLFGILFCFAVAAAYRLQKEVDDYGKRPRPMLKLAKVYVPSVSLVVVPDLSGSQYVPQLDIARAVIKNDPLARAGDATARNAIIKLSFYRDEDLREGENEPIINGDFYGRWTQNEQPGTRGAFAPIDDIRRRDLLPNGENNEIDLVLKYPDDDDCYAFNDDTCRSVEGWRDPKLRLEGRYFKVSITVQGVGMEDWVATVHLRNRGSGQRLEASPTPLHREG